MTLNHDDGRAAAAPDPLYAARYGGCTVCRPMADKKTCIHCARQIDAVARSCPFCNGDQSAPVRPRTAMAPGATVQRPKVEHRWRSKVLGGVALIALLIASFAIGSLIHGFDMPSKSDKTTATTSAQTATTQVPSHPAASDLTLVPVTETTSTVEASITSAPAPNADQATLSEYQRSDATALPSDEYARAAQKVKAEKQKSATVDPRTIVGTPDSGGTPPRTATATPPRTLTGGPGSPSSSRTARQSPVPAIQFPETEPQQNSPSAPPVAARRTNPEPISQPMPRIDVDRPSRATLNLTIGSDGRVKEVEVVQSIPAAMDKLVGAVQNWRFKPATENGVPTTGTFQVNVSFNPSH